MEDDVNLDTESLEDFKPLPVNRPELREGTLVYINNKEHPLFMEQGMIVSRDHVHYRIKIVSTNSAINNTCLWIPEHWIDPLPKELRNEQGH